MLVNEIINTIYGKYSIQSKNRLLLTYNYEHGTILSFKDCIRYLGVEYFLDIGANIGCYAVFMSDIPTVKQIIAFDPNPYAFEEMKKNIFIQDNNNIFCPLQIAASNNTETAIFHIISELAGNNRIIKTNEADNKNIINVQCAPIDEYFSKQKSIVAIKIDVEGHEVQTFEGMINTIKNNTCFIQVECLESKKIEEISTIMKTSGYVLLFALRDDFIFIPNKLYDHFSELQNLYFANLKKELFELLKLRENQQAAANMCNSLMNRYHFVSEPILK